MAITSLNAIKNWFKTGLIPTQTQFWDTWDSFRHKSEKVPVAEIEGIDALLDQKADKAILENHLSDNNAHSDLFSSKANESDFYNHTIDSNAHPNLIAKARIIPSGSLLVFKVAPNVNQSAKEPGDYCMGIVEDRFINGNWNGANDQLKSSYE